MGFNQILLSPSMSPPLASLRWVTPPFQRRLFYSDSDQIRILYKKYIYLDGQNLSIIKCMYGL